MAAKKTELTAENTNTITKKDLELSLLNIGLELCKSYNDPANREPKESVDLALKIFQNIG